MSHAFLFIDEVTYMGILYNCNKLCLSKALIEHEIDYSSTHRRGAFQRNLYLPKTVRFSKRFCDVKINSPDEDMKLCPIPLSAIGKVFC